MSEFAVKLERIHSINALPYESVVLVPDRPHAVIVNAQNERRGGAMGVKIKAAHCYCPHLNAKGASSRAAIASASHSVMSAAPL